MPLFNFKLRCAGIPDTATIFVEGHELRSGFVRMLLEYFPPAYEVDNCIKSFTYLEDASSDHDHVVALVTVDLPEDAASQDMRLVAKHLHGRFLSGVHHVPTDVPALTAEEAPVEGAVDEVGSGIPKENYHSRCKPKAKARRISSLSVYSDDEEDTDTDDYYPLANDEVQHEGVPAVTTARGEPLAIRVLYLPANDEVESYFDQIATAPSGWRTEMLSRVQKSDGGSAAQQTYEQLQSALSQHVLSKEGLALLPTLGSGQGYRIITYGSFVYYGVHTGGDFDFAIVPVDAKWSYDLPRERQVDVVSGLHKFLCGRSGFALVNASDAFVPIVRRLPMPNEMFLDGQAVVKSVAYRSAVLNADPNLSQCLAKLEMDLGCKIGGIRASELLRQYLYANDYARVGGLVVKDLTKKTGVTDSVSRYLASYTIAIMWVFYLLEKQLAGVTFVDLVAGIPDGVSEIANFYEHIDAISDVQVASELFASEINALVKGFFVFYAWEFDWDTRVVSIRAPSAVSKADRGWADRVYDEGARSYYKMCIDDPYIDNYNLSRRIDDTRFDHLMVTFKDIIKRLP